MGLMEPQRGLTVAAVALALSPDARRVVRRGLVYGVAGGLKAGDVLVSAASGAVRGAQSALADQPVATSKRETTAP